MPDFVGARPDEPIEERIARIEDVEAIKRLKAQYAHYCDARYDPDGIASLFVEDGMWETTQPPTVYRSRAEIHEFFKGLSQQFVWALHLMICPVIELSPDRLTATASWYLFSPMTMRDEGQAPDAVITSGMYTDRMVKHDGEWRFQHMKIDIHQMSNLDQGWVKQPTRGA